MSKTTLRKRISLTLVTALTAGVLTSVATSSVANAHAGFPAVGAANANPATTGTVNGSLFVAESLSSSGVGVIGNVASTTNLVSAAALSVGLLAKDTSSGVSQTATMLTGGQLSLYAFISTSVAFVASGGSFKESAANMTYAQDKKTIFMYEQEALNFLMESQQITHDDIQTTIEQSPKYSLVQMTANNMFHTNKRLTWSDVENARKTK